MRPVDPIEALAQREFSRRDALRLAIGLSVSGLALSCCGGTHDHQYGSIEPQALPQIDTVTGGATANQPAVRLTPPKPLYTPHWNGGDLIFAGDRLGPKIVAFTFDDGPWPVNTQGVMNHFKNAGIEGLATFFWVANNAKANPAIAREVAARGYGIANHSLTHSLYTNLGIANEIAPAQQLIKAIVGTEPTLFRSPGLTQGPDIQRVLASLGMPNIFTSTNINDSISPRIPTSEIVTNLSNTIHAGNIILAHDGGTHTQTVNAVPLMIQVARSKDFDIVPIEQLLATGILQKRTQALTQMHTQILADTSMQDVIAKVGAQDAAWYAELLTAQTMATTLSPEQNQLIERELQRTVGKTF